METEKLAFTFDELLACKNPEEFFMSAYPYKKLMMEYKCAMLEVKTKFEVLSNESSLLTDSNPIESIACRMKRPVSIFDKLKRKGLDISLENIEKNIFDIAGIRIVCSFVKDIYHIADEICKQDDIRLLRVKDYIKEPKPNGYRSLHMILSVPVFFSKEKKWLPVEVQLRTIAMDFWASLEHKLRYKKEIATDDAIRIHRNLRDCAIKAHELDLMMQEINLQIENESIT